eukprot:3650176-Pleurochrysis_carterae.AAC.1
MNLQGLPISWSELWSKLRRFPRSHHMSAAASSAHGEDSTGAESLRRSVTREAAPAESMPLPLVNGVT